MKIQIAAISVWQDMTVVIEMPIADEINNSVKFQLSFMSHMSQAEVLIHAQSIIPLVRTRTHILMHTDTHTHKQIYTVKLSRTLPKRAVIAPSSVFTSSCYETFRTRC